MLGAKTENGHWPKKPTRTRSGNVDLPQRVLAKNKNSQSEDSHYLNFI